MRIDNFDNSYPLLFRKWGFESTDIRDDVLGWVYLHLNTSHTSSQIWAHKLTIFCLTLFSIPPPQIFQRAVLEERFKLPCWVCVPKVNLVVAKCLPDKSADYRSGPILELPLEILCILLISMLDIFWAKLVASYTCAVDCMI